MEIKTELGQLSRKLKTLESATGADAIREDLVRARELIETATRRLSEPGYPAPKKHRQISVCSAMVRPTVAPPCT